MFRSIASKNYPFYFICSHNAIRLLRCKTDVGTDRVTVPQNAQPDCALYILCTIQKNGGKYNKCSTMFAGCSSWQCAPPYNTGAQIFCCFYVARYAINRKNESWGNWFIHPVRKNLSFASKRVHLYCVELVLWLMLTKFFKIVCNECYWNRFRPLDVQGFYCSR